MFFRKTRVSLGQGYLDRYTIFEFKRFISVYAHVFNTIEQDRFHSHAFNGLAIVLKGGYEEEFIELDGTIHKNEVTPGIRYIPRNYNHRLLRSKPNSFSVLFAGPWADTWTEEKDGEIRVLGWGRKVIEHRRRP